MLILGLAGIELNFFMVGHMMLCFGSVTKTINGLATSEQYLHSIKVYPAPHTVPPERNLGVHKDLGGNRDGTGNPNRTK